MEVNTDLSMNEIVLAGKCRSCNGSMQMNYGIMESSTSSNAESPLCSQAEESESESSDVGEVNLENTIFNVETPSDALKDLMED